MNYKSIIRTLKAPHRTIQLSLLLPLQFNDKHHRSLIIAAMGKHAIDFSRELHQLNQTHRILLTNDNFALLLLAGKNYATVIKAFLLLYDYQKEMANTSNLQRLVKIGACSYEYVQSFLIQEEAAKNLFETRSSTKNIKLIGSLNINSAFSHKVLRSVKEKDLSADGAFKFETKQWVSKSCQRIKTALTQADWIIFIAKMRHKASFDQEDINSLRVKCYQSIAFLYHDNRAGLKDLVASRDQLELFIKKIDQLEPNNPTYQGYGQIIPKALEALEKIMIMFPLGGKISAHDVFFDDITNILLLPENWVSMLKSAARAEMEVVAQELRRAFCPSDLFGVNPYPKYRISLPCHSQRIASLAHELPLVYISSELINLQDGLVIQGEQLNLYYQHSNKSYSKKPYPVSNITGLGAACLFAKFLGDNDPKNGNIVVSVIDEVKKNYVVVGLDSDHCFARSQQKALFANPWEVTNNPLTRETYYHNYFFLRYEGATASEVQAKSTLNICYDGTRALAAIAGQKKTQRENFVTAFNLAFIPPEAYLEFIEQYLSLSNPFVAAAHSCPAKAGVYHRVKKQILDEQKALRETFESNEDFLNFFLNSDEIEDNIFYRHERLSKQAMEFCFYQKHTFAKTELFKRDDQIIYNYFLDFLEAKAKDNPSLLPKLQKHFDSWLDFLQREDISHDEWQLKQSVILKKVDLAPSVTFDFSAYSASSDKTDVIRYTPPHIEPHSNETTDELFNDCRPIVFTRQPTVQGLSKIRCKI